MLMDGDRLGAQICPAAVGYFKVKPPPTAPPTAPAAAPPTAPAAGQDCKVVTVQGTVLRYAAHTQALCADEQRFSPATQARVWLRHDLSARESPPKLRCGIDLAHGPRSGSALRLRGPAARLLRRGFQRPANTPWFRGFTHRRPRGWAFAAISAPLSGPLRSANAAPQAPAALRSPAMGRKNSV